jgi:hypothetical protein
MNKTDHDGRIGCASLQPPTVLTSIVRATGTDGTLWAKCTRSMMNRLGGVRATDRPIGSFMGILNQAKPVILFENGFLKGRTQERLSALIP